MQLPPFIPVLAAFLFALFICVILHLFIRSRSLMRTKSPGPSNSAEMDPSNCALLIRNQITQVQTFPHPSIQGRQNTQRLSDLLLTARLYFPGVQDQLSAFAERLPEVYEDEGLFLMALMDLRKWLNTHLQNPEQV